jgi:hypothetical protein
MKSPKYHRQICSKFNISVYRIIFLGWTSYIEGMSQTASTNGTGTPACTYFDMSENSCQFSLRSSYFVLGPQISLAIERTQK